MKTVTKTGIAIVGQSGRGASSASVQASTQWANGHASGGEGPTLVTPSRGSVVPFSRRAEVAPNHYGDGQRAGSHSQVKMAEANFRDAAAQLCLKTVALALCVPLKQLISSSRCKADIALACQIAMYLAHTQFSMAMTEVGLAFKRDRTTVSHACRLVEDKRDDDTFDLTLSQLEALLGEAVNAIEARCICFDGGNDEQDI